MKTKIKTKLWERPPEEIIKFLVKCLNTIAFYSIIGAIICLYTNSKAGFIIMMIPMIIGGLVGISYDKRGKQNGRTK